MAGDDSSTPMPVHAQRPFRDGINPFVFPEEGMMSFTDNWVIPTTATPEATAAACSRRPTTPQQPAGGFVFAQNLDDSPTGARAHPLS